MRTLLLIFLMQLACACTPRAVRCDGRLEPINPPVASQGAASGTAADPASGGR